MKLSKKAPIPIGYNWTVDYHNGITKIPLSMELHLEPEQKDGFIKGEILAERLKKTALNGNHLDYLLKHPELIPDSWKGQYVYFWGTVYRDADGRLFVRCLYWRGGRWDWGYDWLGGDWYVSNPAAVSASISTQTSEPKPSLSLTLAIETVKKAGYQVSKIL
jgi:hypothetical protein